MDKKQTLLFTNDKTIKENIIKIREIKYVLVSRLIVIILFTILLHFFLLNHFQTNISIMIVIIGVGVYGSILFVNIVKLSKLKKTIDNRYEKYYHKNSI